MTPADQEIAVVGAGVVGLSTAHALAEAGHAVTVYEAAAPGSGQSAAESRLFRHAHDDPRMVRLAQESRAVWREWEERFGTELVSRDGALALGDSAIERLAVMRDAGQEDVEEVGAQQVAERLPLLAPYEGPAIFDAGAGAIRTRAAVSALAGGLGEPIRTTAVISLRDIPGGVEVRTTEGRFEHARLVVCAGRHTASLARTLALSLPVTLSAHVRLQFEATGRDDRPLACIQDSSGEFGEEGIYGAPLPGGRAYAVGLSETAAVGEDGAVVDPDALGSLADRTRAYVERALPGLDPEPTGHLHCWVTTLPWSDDGLAVWEAGPVLFLAGHNLFKQAPILGRVLASAALGEKVDERFRADAKLGQPETD